MKKIWIRLCGLLAIYLILPGIFSGCGNEANTAYEQITAEEAQELMESESVFFVVDARTDSEFAEGHIPGAMLIHEYEVAEKAEEKIPDKEALILVYCRSGRRSKIAAEELVKLGYTNVKEFGGIVGWPYETVK
ncbi:MAG: rhodanese-like domain-containing protein [Eubacteriales bacterium]